MTKKTYNLCYVKNVDPACPVTMMGPRSLNELLQNITSISTVQTGYITQIYL